MSEKVVIKRGDRRKRKQMLTRFCLKQLRGKVHTCFLHCPWSNPDWLHSLSLKSTLHCRVSCRKRQSLSLLSSAFVSRWYKDHPFYCGSVQEIHGMNEWELQRLEQTRSVLPSIGISGILFFGGNASQF